jgi:hypothetical protein
MPLCAAYLRGSGLNPAEEMLVWITRFTPVAELPAGTTEGENVYVAPGGRPEAESVTALSNVVDPTGVTTKLNVAAPPALTV